jgi:hypothetical protein
MLCIVLVLISWNDGSSLKGSGDASENLIKVGRTCQEYADRDGPIKNFIFLISSFEIFEG